MIKKPYICNRFIEIMRVFAIITFIICSCIKTYADPSKFYLSGLEILMQEHGLANNTLLEIHQDKKGFLWLGTDVGVSRYDGIHFHNYNLEGREPQAVNRICEMEKDSLLWLKLNNNRIACFDKKTAGFYSLEFADSTLTKGIYDLCVADSVLYAITRKGIVRLDYEVQDKSIVIQPTIAIEHQYSLKKLHHDDTYLYATDEADNILVYNQKTKSKKILDYKRLKTDKRIENIYALNNHLWISTYWNGTYCYNPASDEVRRLESAEGALNRLSISGLEAKDETKFIAATPHSILSITFSGTDYIKSSIHVQEMSFDNSLYNSFIQNRITKLYVDRKNDVIWLGTFGKGLVKSNIQDKDIYRILLHSEIRDINNLAQDARGYIWLSTDRNGVWKSTSNQITPELKFELWDSSKSNQYYCMHKDMNGALWIGDENGTVQCLNPLTNKAVSLQPTYDGVTSIGSIQKIYLCIRNWLWLVTSKGLFVYDYIADKCVASMSFNETI